MILTSFNTVLRCHLSCNETSCLSPSLGDLSSLEYLEILRLDRCHNTDFTITDLPASLQRLGIEGLNRDNFQLNETSGMFEDMLETSLEMYVNNASMCSSGILSAIFGQRFMNGIQCKLNIRTNEDVSSFRGYRPDECVIHSLYVYVQSFSLTVDDVRKLQYCHLKELSLAGTFCLSPSLTDLSSLSKLETLDLNNCEDIHIKINVLPTSLRILKIIGLTEQNFQLADNTGSSMGSLEEITVTHAQMCYPETLLQIVGVNTSGVNCLYEILELKTTRDLTFMREDLKHGVCKLEMFDARKMWYFNLTIGDVLILKRCPLKTMVLDDTRCFSESVRDLSELTTLTSLWASRCRSNTFLITGLPESLELLVMVVKAAGINEQGTSDLNIRLNNTGGRFGDALRVIAVRYGSYCSSKSMMKMFGRHLSHVKCWFTDLEIITRDNVQ